MRRVDALPYVHLDSGVIIVGLLLARKSLNVSLAALIDVIDNPPFLRFAFARGPFSFAY